MRKRLGVTIGEGVKIPTGDDGGDLGLLALGGAEDYLAG